MSDEYGHPLEIEKHGETDCCDCILYRLSFGPSPTFRLTCITRYTELHFCHGGPVPVCIDPDNITFCEMFVEVLL